ncbi:MAG TPA: zinc ribbon domain-containing protein [Candidatus Limnocylindrales bacterium]|nr:zinc ribbon domain-containing protein [Candidatus Limnocylindrales bacterium]
MDSIGDAIADAFATVFADPFVGLLFRLIAAYIVLIWLASALWVFVDTRRRSTSLVAAYGSAAMVILATPLLFPAAVLVHTVIRPDELASERHLEDLRHTAFELDVEPRCDGCDRRVEDDWLLCPWCRRQLTHRCQSCGRPVGLDWTVCGWCAADLDGSGGATMRRRAGA